MSSIETFNFTGHQLRVVTINGAPWFVARDICLALGVYLGPSSGQPNVTMAMQKLDADEAQLNRIELKPGYPRKVALVNESGLYKMVMRSDKPQARQFQDWVTREVLPAIRKTGGYILKDADRSKIQEGTVSAEDLASLITKLVGAAAAPARA